jgi:exo-1,4-beta-D-glucosaminidase
MASGQTPKLLLIAELKLTRKIMRRRDFLNIGAVAVALAALTSCSSRNGMHDSGLDRGRSGGATANTSGGPAESPASGARLMLRDGWQVQTSTGQPDGEAISKAGFATNGWFATTIPATVSGVLAQEGVYPDPFVSTNLRSWPGMGRGRGGILRTNPFTAAWWFRTEFNLPAEMAGRAITLHFEGINYRAEVWLNGQQIAGTNVVEGAMRRFSFDVTKVAKPGAKNALALKIKGQGPRDLGHTWVDWAPMPPDNMQGLWRDVFVTGSGVLRINDPFVHSRIATNLDSADVIVSMDLENTSDKPVAGVVAVMLDGVVTKIPVTVAGGTTQKVSLDGKDQPGLHLTKPRLWWPVGFGSPEMYSLKVGVTVSNKVSDERTIRFGVREVTSELTSETNRLYFINHHPILIRGAGWARNLFFMETPRREEQEMRLVHDMGLNAVRFEGKIGSDHLLDLADENGIFVMPGFCCCDYWEQWGQWDDATKAIAVASLHDQLLLLRNHPSMLMFWYASDKFPPPEVEREYLKVIAQTEWPNPTVASASGVTTTVGPSGVKMQGPYDYEPPSYWYGDRDGQAFGFATEIGTGKTLPSIEDMRRMLGDDHLWPQDNVWIQHSQGGAYTPFTPFNDGMRGRYGAATNLDDYVRKAQVIAYDNERAMFEAYGRNKYKSTGVIKWMLNNAWPSLAWHLYDYYLEPGSGYYGTKKSLEPLHVQYSFDDHSIVVVNSTLNQSSGLKVRATVVDIAGNQRWSNSTNIDLLPDGVVRAFNIPELANLSTTYFLSLTLEDGHGAVVSRNFYWLSTVADVLDWTKRQWYITPTKVHGDFTELTNLPPVTLDVKTAFDHDGPDNRALVTVKNPGPAVAFFVRLRVLNKPNGEQILPSIWSDNYVSLLPGETRTLTARWRPEDAPGATPAVAVDGWNVLGK